MALIITLLLLTFMVAIIVALCLQVKRSNEWTAEQSEIDKSK